MFEVDCLNVTQIATVVPTGPDTGLLLEDGTSFLLLENNDFLVQES